MVYINILIGGVLAVLFILLCLKGDRFSSILENLDEKDFPAKDLYCAGFELSSKKLFRLRGKLSSELKNSAAMLYEPQYADYYANVAWAQALTFAILIPAVSFLLAGVMSELSAFMILVGLFLTLLCVVYCLQRMKNAVSDRTKECDSQLPELVSSMAILINSGMTLRDAWATVAENGNGAIYDLMRQALDNMRNGISAKDAIYIFGQNSNSVEIKRFVSALIQSMEKDARELSSFLTSQSGEIWKEYRESMLQAGEKAAGKLLLPIVLIFIGIMIIVVTAAFAGSLF